jgi:molecular chaperone GrpE
MAMAEVKEPAGSDVTPNGKGTTSEEGDDRPQFQVSDKRFWAAHGGGDDAQEGPSTATPSRMPTYIERLEAQLQEKERLLRTHVADMRAEQDELRRRLARELEQRLQLATGDLLADFLPVLDNLDRALQATAQQSNLAALLEGIHLVRTQFLGILARHGLQPLDRQGQPFDPHFDEAVTSVEVTDPRQHNLVLQEWEKGYTLHDNVLRPAKVAVGKLRAED